MKQKRGQYIREMHNTINILFRSIFFLILVFVLVNPLEVRGAIKWNPGHYAYNPNPDRDVDKTREALEARYITGIMVRYFWAKPPYALETAKGVYNFESLRAQIEKNKVAGKRTHLIIFDQDYWSGNDCVPEYMRNTEHPDYELAYKGGQVVHNDRCVPKYWVPAVMDRIIALHEALGKEFDNEEYFEAVSTGETATGPAAKNDPDFSNNALVEQFMRLQVALRDYYPQTLGFLGLNWAPKIQSLFENAYVTGTGIGGPDLVVPCYGSTAATPYYQTFRGKIPLERGGQNGLMYSYGCAINFEEIFDFAVRDVEGIQVTHMSWSYPYRPEGFTFNSTILPMIEKQNGYIANTVCPENIVNFRGGCTSGTTPPPQGPPSLSLKTPPSPIVSNPQSLLEIQTNQSGTLSFQNCTFTPQTVQEGSTRLTLTSQEKKTYSNCKIILTNSQKEQSTPLTIPSFTLSYRGDLNQDRKVDIFDFTILVANFGKNECSNLADLNDDCKVDIFDFTIFLGEFGRGV